MFSLDLGPFQDSKCFCKSQIFQSGVTLRPNLDVFIYQISELFDGASGFLCERGHLCIERL